MYSLTYIEPARQDAREAKKWYQSQRDGLDKRFAESLKSTLAFIQRHPLAYSVRYKNVRVAYTKIFPYAVHYLVQESKNQIIVLAIVHIKRRPEATQTREI
jgi:plasmid stabilization system protein ParE